MKIYLIRHGESDGNKEGRFIGANSPYGLTDEGIKHAKNAAKVLKREKLSNGYKVFSSPAIRAQETAQIICEELGTFFEKEPLLTEIDLGEFEDLHKSQVSKEYKDVIQKFSNSPSECEIPGGESIPDVQKRILSFIYDKIDEDYDLVLISHDIVIRSFLVHAMSMSLDYIWSLGIDELAWGIKSEFQYGDADVPLGSTSVVEYNDGEFIVEKIGLV